MIENKDIIKEEYEINGQSQDEIKALAINLQTGAIIKVSESGEQDIKNPFSAIITSNQSTFSNGKVILPIVGFRDARKKIFIPIVPPEEMWNYQAPIPVEYSQRIADNPDWPMYFRDYLRQLYKNGTFPKLVKEIIQERKIITKNDLKEVIQAHGYVIAGNLSATLSVLEKVTRQIVREGHRNNQKYTWVGTTL